MEKQILVVDDDPAVRKLLEGYLADHGFRVLSAESGAGMTQKLAKHSVDLVILDLMMPNIDGFKVCQKIKSTRQTRHIKILVLTGYASPENIQKALECGADLCMAKPFKISDLQEKIEELFAGGSPRAERASQGG